MKLKFFFANFQVLGPLGWVVIPQNVKKSKNHCTLVRTTCHWMLTEGRRLSVRGMLRRTAYANIALLLQCWGGGGGIFCHSVYVYFTSVPVLSLLRSNSLKFQPLGYPCIL
jgi:hypothetical protein